MKELDPALLKAWPVLAWSEKHGWGWGRGGDAGGEDRVFLPSPLASRVLRLSNTGGNLGRDLGQSPFIADGWTLNLTQEGRKQDKR